jgi:hypothetical protein
VPAQEQKFFGSFFQKSTAFLRVVFFKLQKCFVNLTEQLVEIHRFRMIIVASGLQGTGAIGRHRMCGERDHRHTLCARAQCTGDGPAIHDRQVHVEQDDIRRFGRNLIQRLLAVMRQYDGKAAAAQAA